MHMDAVRWEFKPFEFLKSAVLPAWPFGEVSSEGMRGFPNELAAIIDITTAMARVLLRSTIVNMDVITGSSMHALDIVDICAVRRRYCKYRALHMQFFDVGCKANMSFSHRLQCTRSAVNTEYHLGLGLGR